MMMKLIVSETQNTVLFSCAR